MKIEELKGLLQIDKNNLDEAVQRQPVLYYMVAQKHALALSQRDEAYDRIKTVDAELSLDLREDFGEKGIKFTEGTIQAAILDHPDHKAAVKDHNHLKYVCDELLALKESYSQRSYMLRELVELYVSGYYGSDNVVAKGKKPNARLRSVSNEKV